MGDLLLWLAYYRSNWISSSQINNPLPMTIICVMFVLAWWKDFCSYLSHISYILLASYPMFGQSYKLLVRAFVDFNKGTYCHIPEKLLLQILLVSEWGNVSYANHKVSINLNNITGGDWQVGLKYTIGTICFILWCIVLENCEQEKL